MGATIYFDNLQSGEVTQLLNTMGHHTVGLKLHRKGDRSPEPGQTWTHEVFSSHSSEVVLVSSWLAGCSLSSSRHSAPFPGPRLSILAFLSHSHPLLSVEPACSSYSRVAATAAKKSSVGLLSGDPLISLVRGARRQVGCFARIFENYFLGAQLCLPDIIFLLQRPGLVCESEAGQQSP